MGILAWSFGILGGLSAVMGIITASGVIAKIGPEFTWWFWLLLSVILLLASIACAISRAETLE